MVFIVLKARKPENILCYTCSALQLNPDNSNRQAKQQEFTEVDYVIPKMSKIVPFNNLIPLVKTV